MPYSQRYHLNLLSKPSNYRPVSFTSVVCKLMERIVKDVIQDQLLKNNLLHNSQHGFLPHKSCTLNLLEFLGVITQEIDTGTPVDVLYLEFLKAFDKVPHQRLLLKIESLNIQGNTLNWITDWLKNIRQKVVIDNLFFSMDSSHIRSPTGECVRSLVFHNLYQ